ncbi:hypothetical protein EVAR_46590_1 [Eumeta japonica]|uniref:Uncharacterized protein n=1 Tax=Eumeta variegata TaxID=151549 RepID=A0A4C1WQS3_EUMVA|nr:hypothetical protein EVAR_46590_1 [Eumeta japonica]
MKKKKILHKCVSERDGSNRSGLPQQSARAIAMGVARPTNFVDADSIICQYIIALWPHYLHRMQYNARNSAALNYLRCADTLPSSAPRSYDMPLQRFRD